MAMRSGFAQGNNPDVVEKVRSFLAGRKSSVVLMHQYVRVYDGNHRVDAFIAAPKKPVSSREEFSAALGAVGDELGKLDLPRSNPIIETDQNAAAIKVGGTREPVVIRFFTDIDSAHIEILRLERRRQEESRVD